MAGFQAGGNAIYRSAVEAFFSIVTSAHSYVTGGSNDHEYWGPANTMADAVTSVRPSPGLQRLALVLLCTRQLPACCTPWGAAMGSEWLQFVALLLHVWHYYCSQARQHEGCRCLGQGHTALLLSADLMSLPVQADNGWATEEICTQVLF